MGYIRNVCKFSFDKYFFSSSFNMQRAYNFIRIIKLLLFPLALKLQNEIRGWMLNERHARHYTFYYIIVSLDQKKIWCVYWIKVNWISRPRTVSYYLMGGGGGLLTMSFSGSIAISGSVYNDVYLMGHQNTVRCLGSVL